MSTYTSSYDPPTPFVRPDPAAGVLFAAPDSINNLSLDEDSPRPLTYLFNVPQGAEVEWPIRVLEDDLVRLDPVDTRMALYLSTVTTQAWNVVRPVIRTRLEDQGHRMEWVIVARASGERFGTAGFLAFDPLTRSLTKPFLKPAPSTSPLARLQIHVSAQYLILSFVLALPIRVSIAAPPAQSFVFWGANTRETEDSLGWAEDLGLELAEGEKELLMGRMNKKKKEPVKAVDCTFGVQQDEGSSTKRAVLYCR